MHLGLKIILTAALGLLTASSGMLWVWIMGAIINPDHTLLIKFPFGAAECFFDIFFIFVSVFLALVLWLWFYFVVIKD